MDNNNYYFLQIVTQVKELGDKWNNTEIPTTANLVTGDIINFRNESFNDDLIVDFQAKEFIVKKRVFLCDSNFENVGGIFHLYIEPVFN
ncbi:hypothetical protein SAMN05660493_01524 [Epilithonimonas bovis DSM 19482]|uniref:Uncharacterized protein n=1 Tax=Epilithonimonas bovis DSM 19482 TaxID=1121284 RepID=A0A1U7PVB4_9FLAO|nr:hypothetical protein [Epilithonimonas bovis]SIT96829.1 hypothetical protein SAMN05660493_01524 [Epilithonimonas bovis DSM 19482]